MELKHRGMAWLKPWRPENLFEEESGLISAGVGDGFGSESRLSEIATFCFFMSLPDGFRALKRSWLFACEFHCFAAPRFGTPRGL